MAADHLFQMLMGFDEFPRVLVLHQAEAYEQPAEQQNFGSDEQPHTQLAGIELLLHRGEMMLMVRVVLVIPVPAVRMNVRGSSTHLVRHRLGPVIVRLVLEHRLLFKIVRDGGRGSLPLQGCTAPGVVGRVRGLAKRCQQHRRLS